MNFPHYRDFFQKALIPIGSSDISLLLDSPFQHSTQSTHWLIALEGELADLPNEYYHWKVRVYTSDVSGSFDWKNPYYTSPLFEYFEQASLMARSLELQGRNDDLCVGCTDKIIS